MLPGIDGFEVCRSHPPHERRADHHGHGPGRHPRRGRRARGRRRRLPHQAVRAQGAVGPHPGPAAPGPHARPRPAAAPALRRPRDRPRRGRRAASAATRCTSPRPSSACSCELASSPGRVFSREVLLERVWGYGYFGDGRLVDVHVRRLRTKVEADPANPRHVVTVRGLGYKLQGCDGRPARRARRRHRASGARPRRAAAPASGRPPRPARPHHARLRPRRPAPVARCWPAPPTRSPARTCSTSGSRSALAPGATSTPACVAGPLPADADDASRLLSVAADAGRRRNPIVLPGRRRGSPLEPPSSARTRLPRRAAPGRARRRRGRRACATTSTARPPRRRHPAPGHRRDAAYFEIVDLDETEAHAAIARHLAPRRVGAHHRAPAPPSGWWASRRALRPLGDVSQAAEAIAGGRLDTRLEATGDPDLGTPRRRRSTTWPRPSRTGSSATPASPPT